MSDQQAGESSSYAQEGRIAPYASAGHYNSELKVGQRPELRLKEPHEAHSLAIPCES